LPFAPAAIRLNMTQPTLSRQVQALERALKVQLFERANRSVRLTTAGRGFLPEAKRILALAESASTWARRTARGEAGIIRLGFTATAAFVDVPLILDRVAKAMPDVRVQLKEGTSAVQRDALLADLIDVALLRPPIDRSCYEAILLRREKFVAALHADDPRTKKAELTLADFGGSDFIMYSAEGAGYSHAILNVMFNRAGVSPNMVHFLDQNHSILAMVSAGMGAALVPDSLVMLSLPGVVFKPVALDAQFPLEMYMIWRPQNDNPVLSTFLSLCEPLAAAAREICE
jgi:DNA-binding transcriptional LysR family regulator